MKPRRTAPLDEAVPYDHKIVGFWNDFGTLFGAR